MFFGTYRYRVDAKGRLAIPSRFRAGLDGAHISVAPDGVLAIYPEEEFRKLADRVPGALMATDEQRQLSRALYSSAMPLELDSQGRVTLSPEQRKVAGIEPNSSVVVIGNGQTVEIWPEARWDSYSGGALPRFTELVNRVFQA